MKHTDLARKVKELRARKGYSQEELAEQAQLNLRTIQRIEAGKTEPRGDTLKRLALALDVPSVELIDWTEQEDNTFLVLLNLSALSFIAFSLLGIFLPLIFWILKKDKIRHVNETGKKLINFQITWCIVKYGSFAFFIIDRITHTGYINYILPRSIFGLGPIELGLIAIPGLLYLYNIVLIVVNCIRTHNGKGVVYLPAIPFLR